MTSGGFADLREKLKSMTPHRENRNVSSGRKRKRRDSEDELRAHEELRASVALKVST